jgi:IclR family acetate operon transcriptional repressor
VTQDPVSKSYMVGPGLLQLGLQAVRGLDIRVLAHSTLTSLAQESGETSHLFMLQQAQVICLDSVETTRVLRVGGRIGETLPAYATAAGRVLLAELPPATLRQIYPQSRFPALQPSTISTRKELDSELKRIRELGYAVQERQNEADVSAISAAVEDSRGPAKFALTISIPSSRFDLEDAGRLGKLLRDGAADVARLLP